jgi:hypothetical protein
VQLSQFLHPAKKEFGQDAKQSSKMIGYLLG